MPFVPYGQLTDVTHRWSNGDLLAGQQFRNSYGALENRDTAGGQVSPESSYWIDRLNQIANPTASVTVNSNAADRQGEYFHYELGGSNSHTGPTYLLLFRQHGFD